jgi:hypothetical protein
MKIVGGSFGLKGNAKIQNEHLILKGAREATYHAVQIKTLAAITDKERKFGILGFLVGFLFFGVVLFLFFGPLGLLVALIFSVAGSFYTQKSNVVTIIFDDGETMDLAGSGREVKRLVAMKPAPSA